VGHEDNYHAQLANEMAGHGRPVDVTPEREALSCGDGAEPDLQDTGHGQTVFTPEPGGNGDSVPHRGSVPPLRATDWILFVCLGVLTLPAAYSALKIRQYHRSLEQLTAIAANHERGIEVSIPRDRNTVFLGF
jgi:hypothetical protein